MWQRFGVFRRTWVVCGIVALCVKLAIALSTIGTTDVLTFQSFAEGVTVQGPLWLYHTTTQFNHPPFMARVLIVLNRLSGSDAMGFPFWLRLPAILSDFGSLCLMALILRPHPRLLVLLAICPISILVSGFHGNTDPVMVFFILLSIYCLERRNWVLASGVALGVAASVKIPALVVAPAFVFYLPSNRRRGIFVLALCATFVLLSSPYLFEDPAVIARNVFGYYSNPGVWGLTHLAGILERLVGGHDYVALAARVGRFVVGAAVIGVMVFLARRPFSLYARCAISMFIFLFLLPGFGVQYLAWLVPFALFFGEAWTIAVYASSGVFLFLVYNYWSDGLPWSYAAAEKFGGWPRSIVPLELIAWFVIGLTLLEYFRQTLKNGSFETIVDSESQFADQVGAQ